MSKTILVPTDLSIESLNTLKLAMNQVTERVNIILMFPVALSNSIQDLLFYSSRKIISEAVSAEFYEGLSILENRYEKTIITIRIELFHGNNLNAFAEFVKGNKIDEAFVPLTYKLKLNTFDPIVLIKKSSIKYVEVNWDVKDVSPQMNRLDFLFNN